MGESKGLFREQCCPTTCRYNSDTYKEKTKSEGVDRSEVKVRKRRGLSKTLSVSLFLPRVHLGFCGV